MDLSATVRSHLSSSLQLTVSLSLCFYVNITDSTIDICRIIICSLLTKKETGRSRNFTDPVKVVVVVVVFFSYDIENNNDGNNISGNRSF